MLQISSIRKRVEIYLWDRSGSDIELLANSTENEDEVVCKHPVGTDAPECLHDIRPTTSQRHDSYLTGWYPAYAVLELLGASEILLLTGMLPASLIVPRSRHVG